MAAELPHVTDKSAYPHTILLVDDSPVNLGLVVENLELQGYEVLVAQDGEEALQRAEVVLPDIVLLDVMMPDMDGFEVCRRLKEAELTRNIPVVFMTSLGRLEDKIKGFAAGAVDYVTKPLQMDELRARVGAHLKLRDLQRQLEEKNLRLQSEIDERKRMEEWLRAREQQYRALAENSPDVITRFDLGLRRIYANPACIALGGASFHSLLGKRLTEVSSLPDKAARRLHGMLEEVLETGAKGEMELAWTERDGTQKCYSIHAVPELDDAGRFASILVVGRDVSSLKEAERYLEESRTQLRELAMQRDFEQEEARRRIASEVHEGIGQHLMALRINLSMLSGLPGMKDGEGGERVGIMRDALAEAVRLVRKVTTELRPSVLDLGMGSALEWLAGRCAEQKIACLLHLPEEDIALDEMHSMALFRVVEEALNNVVRHAEAGKVSVTLESKGDGYRLVVRDDGKGFDINERRRGRGYGLEWAQEQVAGLGGEFVVFSMPGQGTVIEVTLPAQPRSEAGESST